MFLLHCPLASDIFMLTMVDGYLWQCSNGRQRFREVILLCSMSFSWRVCPEPCTPHLVRLPSHAQFSGYVQVNRPRPYAHYYIMSFKTASQQRRPQEPSAIFQEPRDTSTKQVMLELIKLGRAYKAKRERLSVEEKRSKSIVRF